MINKYLSPLWKRPRESEGLALKSKLMDWRREGVIVKIDKPTRPDRARALGYKAKQGFVVVRVRVRKGLRKRPKVSGGRRPKRAGRFFSTAMSKKGIAEQKVGRKYPNMEVLNSYYVGEDGVSHWYEVILLDKAHPSVNRDRERKWVAEKQHKRRVFRALTSSGKRHRGLRRKGKGAEKLRPSLKARRGLGK